MPRHGSDHDPAAATAPGTTTGTATTGTDQPPPAASRNPPGTGDRTPPGPRRGTTGGDHGSAAGRRTAGGPPRGSLRRPGRTVIAAVAAVAAAGAVGAAAIGWGGGNGTAGAAPPGGPPATATVERTTLVRTEKVTGSLGHGEATTVQAAEPDALLTWLPEAGDVIGRGETVYRVNERPVPLLYGSLPLYRPLAEGSEGKDVRQLEQNLEALGHTGFTVDHEFTGGTADALRAWQRELGLAETGTLAPGQAVIAPGGIRVDARAASPGGAATGPVLSWTGTERVISVDLDVALEGLVAEGTSATVTLPDGTEAQAEVTAVGTAATTTGTGTGTTSTAATGTAGTPTAVIPVELTALDEEQLGGYQAAPVDVVLEAERREEVLAVPVTALVALREGGYAVEVVEDSATRYLAVDTGLFADGLVEISGDGLAPGLTVGVPG
ncbi:peptidoglycan-binding domain-containing protein [Streptomyces aidingensis]|uniref:Multidrug efflux pump subunit AcrA (Membrane-fusion protein) n=1 Tax=Streptomyces aidingensis TaxID=910347 RepID=A0A1I1UY75_9ACTN|nr:peptidoglycan-binding domain-containing protein [Streptomyces aidingensis]SFD75757.1 Multidrug efflux pump subunit AcrA (membrane-fusion protein) [Streptomyces aidingensis]